MTAAKPAAAEVSGWASSSSALTLPVPTQRLLVQMEVFFPGPACSCVSTASTSAVTWQARFVTLELMDSTVFTNRLATAVTLSAT